MALYRDESHAEWRFGHSSCAGQRKSATGIQTSNYLEVATTQLHHVTCDKNKHLLCRVTP